VPPNGKDSIGSKIHLLRVPINQIVEQSNNFDLSGIWLEEIPSD
jgi:hypothetical protein